MGGTSRISREAYVRFCERLGVKFPGPTRRRFSSTALSSMLETDAPASLRGFAIAELGEGHYPAWAELLHSMRNRRGRVRFVFSG